MFATTALLGLLQITLETGLYLALAAGVARAGAWFRRPRIRRRLDAVSGTVLVALGLRWPSPPADRADCVQIRRRRPPGGVDGVRDPVAPASPSVPTDHPRLSPGGTATVT